METKRVFIGVVPPEKIISSLSRTMAEYKKLTWGRHVKWVKPDNLHLTLKFIGQLKTDQLTTISSEIESAIQGLKAFQVGITGLTVFPKPWKPGIISAGTEKNPALASLVESIENTLIALGIPKEKKTFKGHITLGRCRKNFPEQQRIVDKIRPATFSVNTLSLFSSILKSEGPEYRVEKRIPLL